MHALFPSSLSGQWPRLNSPAYESEIAMTLSLAVLTTALLFGGMTLYSFGFAAFLFRALPAATACLALRRAFPLFYLFVIVTAVTAAALLWSHDTLAAVAITTVPTRQILMPSINRATDGGQRRPGPIDPRVQLRRMPAGTWANVNGQLFGGHCSPRPC
jgi:hypothetical protein